MVVIIRSYKTNDQSGRKTYVLLECEKGWKVQKVQIWWSSISGRRKYDCPFKLIGKPISNGER